MGRFSRAARQGDSTKGRCTNEIYTEHHQCDHRAAGKCSGSCNVYVNGRCAQKVGDAVTFTACEHGGRAEITDGSGTVFINGSPAARIKDSAICKHPLCGNEQIITEGSENVYFGD